ncbi:MAG: putative quinol monooxygenase [Chryseolinea sp.]
MLIRIVHMHFREDGVDSFLLIFADHVDAIRNMQGCRLLQLLRDADDPLHFTTISHWDDVENLESYRQSELFRRVWGSVKKLFSGPPFASSMEKFLMRDD